MSKLALLAMNRSFAGGRRRQSPFRVDQRGLPKLHERAAKTSEPTPQKPDEVSAKPKLSKDNIFSGARSGDRSGSSVPRRRLPGDGPVSFPQYPPEGSTPTVSGPVRANGAGDPFWRRWFRRQPKSEARWVQGELSLTNVRVVRNDLRDADVEVVAPAPSGSRSGRPLKVAVTGWRRWIRTVQRMGR